jgi:hypothetical protein
MEHSLENKGILEVCEESISVLNGVIREMTEVRKGLTDETDGAQLIFVE